MIRPGLPASSIKNPASSSVTLLLQELVYAHKFATRKHEDASSWLLQDERKLPFFVLYSTPEGVSCLERIVDQGNRANCEIDLCENPYWRNMHERPPVRGWTLIEGRIFRTVNASISLERL